MYKDLNEFVIQYIVTIKNNLEVTLNISNISNDDSTQGVDFYPICKLICVQY